MNLIPEWSTIVRALAVCAGLFVFAWGIASRAWFNAPGFPHIVRSSGRSGVIHFILHILAFAAMVVLVVLVKEERQPFYIDILLIVALFTAYLFATRHISFGNALYSAVLIFLTSDLCVAIINAIYRHAPEFGSVEPYFIEALYVVLMVAICFVLRRFAPSREGAKIPILVYVTLILSMLPYIVIRSSDVLYDLEGTSGSLMEVILFLVIIATFGTVIGSRYAVVAEAERTRRLQLEMEMSELQHRFEVRKETMEEVNRRYHDMVKYAHTFAQGNADGSLDDYLERRMTDDLAVGVLHETGNTVLDAIMWEADEACQKQDIRFVPAADGDAMSFVTPFDMRTIVGNALDNAIEAAVAVEDPEKREVRFRLSRVNQMAFMRVENYFAGTLRRQADVLLTTKEDETSHGFGLDNIRRAVSTYGGSVRFEVEDDRFTLTVMLPIPE